VFLVFPFSVILPLLFFFFSLFPNCPPVPPMGPSLGPTGPFCPALCFLALFSGSVWPYSFFPMYPACLPLSGGFFATMLVGRLDGSALHCSLAPSVPLFPARFLFRLFCYWLRLCAVFEKSAFPPQFFFSCSGSLNLCFCWLLPQSLVAPFFKLLNSRGFRSFSQPTP